MLYKIKFISNSEQRDTICLMFRSCSFLEFRDRNYKYQIYILEMA
jgi:hypothetical protein